MTDPLSTGEQQTPNTVTADCAEHDIGTSSTGHKLRLPSLNRVDSSPERGCQDGDSDAYHFIGHAHSSDALHWAVDHGAANPLVQADYTYRASSPLSSCLGITAPIALPAGPTGLICPRPAR